MDRQYGAIAGNILKRPLFLFLLGVLVYLSVAENSSADTAYRGYNYDAWGDAVPSPSGYEPERLLLGADIGVGNFSNPLDIYVDEAHRLYILDSGNNRIVILDDRFELLDVIDTIHADGQEQALDSPSGLFVTTDGVLYIADTNNNRVVKIDREGNLLREFFKPETELYPPEVVFLPKDVIVDYSDNIYVLVAGIYKGATMYSPEGSFLGFFGNEEVRATSQRLADFFWKRIFTEEQRARMVRYVPVEVGAMAIDEEGFIYTSTENNVKKLNPTGKNILITRLRGNVIGTARFGDIESLWLRGLNIATRFSDVCVDDDEFINVLDRTRGRVFQYDQESNLLLVFGGIGGQMGLFKSPAAIDTIGDRILVLDSTDGSITVFKPTEFGALVHDAVKLYNEGMYEEAVEPWYDVLQRDANFELAYVGIGKSLYKLKEFRDAMRFFRNGYDRTGYSQAMKKYRTAFLRAHFSTVVLIICFVIAGIALYGARKRIFGKSNLHAVKVAAGSPARSNEPLKTRKLGFPLYIAFHPVTGYEELKYQGSGSLAVSIAILLIWFVAAIFDRQLTGFNFNYRNPTEINILFLFARTVVMFALWVISNIAVSEFVEGEGKFRSVWIAYSYALVPYIFTTVIVIVLSNFMAIEEGIFLTWINYIGIIWSGSLVLSALRIVHDYQGGKVVLSAAMTLLGIAIIVFLGVLLVTLFQQLYAFFRTLLSEILFRL
jgi:hypothetical protein